MVRNLIDWLANFPDDNELEIEICETNSSHYIDTTTDISFVEGAYGPALGIDVKAEKLREFLR